MREYCTEAYHARQLYLRTNNKIDIVKSDDSASTVCPPQ